VSNKRVATPLLIMIFSKNEKSSQLPQNYEMNFVLRDGIDEYYEKDCVVKIFCDQVLQIGRNIHLLRLLGKFDVFTKGSGESHSSSGLTLTSTVSRNDPSRVHEKNPGRTGKLLQLRITRDRSPHSQIATSQVKF
jgi:hypothetical protein